MILKILVLETLINQTKSAKTIPPDVLPRIYAEYSTLASLEQREDNSLQQYLRNQNGKSMKGAEHIYKYRLTAGDRLLYTYGKYLPCIREAEKDSLILIAYANHDAQGSVARSFDLEKNYSYVHAEAVIGALDKLGITQFVEEGFDIDALYEVAELLTPDYLRSHTIYVLPDEELKELSPDLVEKYLSKEQDKCLSDFAKDPCPTLIQGGAGTGKTLIAIHALDNYNRANENVWAAYFTQSRELRNRVQKMYSVIANPTTANTIEFLDINGFCQDQLALPVSRFVQTPQFLKFLKTDQQANSICMQHNIDPIDAWTEIRGTIKGFMGTAWKRTRLLSQDEFPDGIGSLVKKGYFSRNENDPKLFSMNMDLLTSVRDIEQDRHLSDKEKSMLLQAYRHFSSFDPNIRSLSFSDYMKLSDEDSSIEKGKRQYVWALFELYEEYLIEAELYDENDLIRLMYKEGNLPQFDLVVVDEVQDYTELQIYFLKDICTSKHNIIFAGDSNQNINPALFREARLQTLFQKGSGGTLLKTVHLTQNFRCTQQIVDTANVLSRLRRQTIGSKSIELEQPEKAMRKGHTPYRLKANPENLEQIFLEALKYPRTAILVPDSATKQQVINIIGQETYDDAIAPCVFTVAEIKGMEYTYVICYNLISRYVSIWEEMFYDKHRTHRTLSRYYFNLLYVAITRSQQHLCFIDDKTSVYLEKSLALNVENTFDADKLHFPSLQGGLADWYSLAMEYQENLQYDVALKILQHVNAPLIDIARCKMGLAEQAHDFDRVIHYSIIVEDVDALMKYIREPMEKSTRQLGELYISLINDGSIPTKGSLFSDVQKTLPMYLSSAEASAIGYRFLEAYRDVLFSATDTITKIVGDLE